MKNKINLLIFVVVASFFAACKKEGAKPAPVTTGTTALTTPDLFVGKWYVAKDSIQTFDSNTQIPNLVQNINYTNNDFVTFNKDSTAVMSSVAAYTAFFTDYDASNVDSKLFINPPVNPNFNFKFKLAAGFVTNTAPGLGVTTTDYLLSMQNANIIISAGYSVSFISSTSLVLGHAINIPTVGHYYVIKEYIYLKK